MHKLPELCCTIQTKTFRRIPGGPERLFPYPVSPKIPGKSKDRTLFQQKTREAITGKSPLEML